MGAEWAKKGKAGSLGDLGGGAGGGGGAIGKASWGGPVFGCVRRRSARRRRADRLAGSLLGGKAGRVEC